MVMVVPQHALFNFITLALMQLILLQFANQYAEMELLWLQNNNVMMVMLSVMMVVPIVLKTVVMELDKNLQNNVMMEIPLMEMAVHQLVLQNNKHRLIQLLWE